MNNENLKEWKVREIDKNETVWFWGQTLTLTQSQ